MVNFIHSHLRARDWDKLNLFVLCLFENNRILHSKAFNVYQPPRNGSLLHKSLNKPCKLLL